MVYFFVMSYVFICISSLSLTSGLHDFHNSNSISYIILVDALHYAKSSLTQVFNRKYVKLPKAKEILQAKIKLKKQEFQTPCQSNTSAGHTKLSLKFLVTILHLTNALQAQVWIQNRGMSSVRSQTLPSAHFFGLVYFRNFIDLGYQNLL